MTTPFLRHVGNIAHPGTRGEQTRLDLPRSALLRKIVLQLRNTITVTTGAGTLLAEGTENLITGIQVVANGSDVLKSYDGPALHKLNFFDFGVLGNIDDAATTTGEMSVGWVIPFAMPRVIRPIDTILDASKENGFSSLELVITWGDENDAFSGVSGTWVFTDLTLDVGVQEIEGLTGKFGLYVDTIRSKSLSGVTGEQTLELPTSDWYRAITIKSHDSGVPATPIDTAIELVSLRSGNTSFINGVGWGDDDAGTQFRGTLNEENNREYGIDVPIGYRRLEFAPDGLLTQMLNSGRLNELDLILDVGTTSTTEDIKAYLHTVVNPTFVTRNAGNGR